MKRKMVFLGGLLLFLAGTFFLIKFFQSRTPNSGELQVESTPTVSVFVDNKLLGRTPVKEKVSTGEHTIRLEPESASGASAPWQGKVIVGPNLRTYVNATLGESELSSAVDILWLEKSLSKKPEISVVTNPDGATVSINDTTKGVSPITLNDVESGEQTLTITSPGFLSRSMKIKLTVGYKLIATMKLALSAGGVPESTPTPTPTPDENTTPTKTPTPTRGPSPTRGGPTPTPAAIPETPYVTIKDTPTGFLRVRADASTSSAEVGRVKPGEMYHIEDEQNGWYQIIYEGTSKGWISGQYATKTE